MMPQIRVIVAVFICGLVRPLAAADYVFETLGVPAQQSGVKIACATRNANGVCIAWGRVESPTKIGVVGARMDTGELTWLNLAKYGRAHIQMCRGADGNLWLYCGRPGRFLKYDVNSGKITDYGIPDKRSVYWLGSLIADDGWFYVGTYRSAGLVRCHTRTGQVENLGRMSDDRRQCYVIHPAIDRNGIVYAPTGLHHRELWAYNTQTRTKKQILPEAMTKQQGTVRVWTGIDGQVYGRNRGTTFLCKPDGIATGKSAARRPSNDQKTAGGRVGRRISPAGLLTVTSLNPPKDIEIQTEWRSPGTMIYSVSCEYGGKIWGGGGFPSSTFSYDPATGKIKNFGRLTGGSIQVYDTLGHAKGLFLTSYTGAHIDFFDPSKPKAKGNPRNIAVLSRKYMQERPVQIIDGPDGMLYVGTFPVKGRLGGALVRINPNDFAVQVWRNVVHNQSIMSLAPVPGTALLLCGTSIAGGSSAKATEKEAVVFLWDTQREEVVWTCKPVEGARYYPALVTAKTGIVYGVANGKYFALDPAKREVVRVGELPLKYLRFPYLSDHPAGKAGLIYGMADDALFAIDPSDHSLRVLARHPSIKKAHGFYVAADGTAYFGSGDTLMRARVQE